MKQEQQVRALRFPGFKGEWKRARLGEVTIWKSGGTPSKDNPKFWGGTIPWISASSMRGTEYYDSDLKISELGLKNGSRLAEKGSLLLLVRGSMLFKCIPIGIATVDVSFNQDVKAIKTLDGIDTKFILYWFVSNEPVILNLVTGTGIGAGKLDLNDLQNIEIKFPALPEQQKIAAFFTAIDQKLQALQQKKALLEQYKKGVMQQLFSQQLRFKDAQGRAFGDWEVRKLGEVCEEHLHKNSNNKFNEVFSVAKHKGVINQIDHLGRSFSAKEITHYKLIYPGDLVYTKSPTSEFPFGIIKQNRTGRIGVVSPLYCVFKPKNYALGFILHEYFSSPINTFNYLNPLVQKGAKNTMNINNDTFLNGAGLLLPIIEAEQIRIADFLTSLDAKIAAVQGQWERLGLWKKGLLQRMFC